MPRPDAVVDRSRIRRVLVIRHRAGGDLLLTTPALRALRAGLPGARITVLAARGMAALLQGNPDVDEVIEIDRKSLPGQAALYARFARGGYDLAVDLVSNPRSAFLTRLTRAPIRAGFDIPGRGGAYTVRVPREPLDAGGRPVRRYAPEAALDVVRALGIEPRGLELTFRVAPAAAASIDRWLADSNHAGPLIACLPTGSWPAKTWLPERFAAAMDSLADEGTVLWLWGPGERDAVEAVRARMRAPSVVAPPTGWQELGALLARCALLVGNDSGPKHLAAAIGTPTVTVYGPTHPTTWHPPAGPHRALLADGLECLHCDANRCPLPGDRHLRCMRDVGAERLVAAARELLHRTAGERTCASR